MKKRKCGCCRVVKALGEFDGRKVCNRCRKTTRERNARQPLIYVWRNLKERCDNKNRYEYARWGGRGITYSEEFSTYEGFIEVALPLYEKAVAKYGKDADLCIDRIDNDGHYERGNIRFVPRSLSGKNTRTANRVRYKGKMWYLSDLAKEIGVRRDLLWERLKRGWTVKQAVELPVGTYVNRKRKV